MAQSSQRPVRLAIIGAGNRGSEVYGGYCLRHPDEVTVVAAADPHPARLRRIGDQHAIPLDRRFEDADALFAAPHLADAVIVATPDRSHTAPAIRALDAGYDVLLEKPIAPTLPELRALRSAVADRSDAVTVAHVLRYTPFFTTIKRLLTDGSIGELQGIEHTENIGFWHFAHSYVRGNWRSVASSSPMILAKACHDLDLLRWIADAPCDTVASFGQRRHFHEDQAPAGAPSHCLDGCPVEDSCPFHASRFYVDHLRDWAGPPVTAVTDDLTPGGRLEALRAGPYGRCVYRCDNDVVDHQVTILRFVNGITATLTVTAFSQENTRVVRYLGSHGEIRGHLDRGEIELTRFRPAPRVAVPMGAPGVAQTGGWTGPATERIMLTGPATEGAVPVWGAFADGHGGGDEGLMSDFVDRLRRRRSDEPVPRAATSLAESVDSHLMAFAVEESRRTGRTVRPERTG